MDQIDCSADVIHTLVSLTRIPVDHRNIPDLWDPMSSYDSIARCLTTQSFLAISPFQTINTLVGVSVHSISGGIVVISGGIEQGKYSYYEYMYGYRVCTFEIYSDNRNVVINYVVASQQYKQLARTEAIFVK